MIKSHFSIRTTLFIIIGVLNVMIALLAGVGVYSSWYKFQQARMLAQNSASINLLYKAQHYLSQERGASFSVTYVDPNIAESLQKDIMIDRKLADGFLTDGLKRIGLSPVKEVEISIARVKERLAMLNKLRSRLDIEAGNKVERQDIQVPAQLFDANTELIMAIRDLIIAYSTPALSIEAVVSQQFMFKYFIWEISEYAGREYAMIGNLIAENKRLTPETQEKLLTWRGLTQHGWETSRRFVFSSSLDAKLLPYMNEAETHYFFTFEQIKSIFYLPEVSPAEEGGYPLSVEMWLGLASEAIDSLLALKDLSLQETQRYVDEMEVQAKYGISLNIILFLCAVAISLYCFAVIVWRVVNPVNSMVDALYKTSLGEAHDPISVVQRDDEIGKLASVLKAFQDSAKKLKQSNEELERYAYITAHDLKSPLRAIDNLSQWIEEDLDGNITPLVQGHLDNLRQRVRRMEKLLNDTLEYSRIGYTANAQSEMVNGKNLIEDVMFMAAPPKDFKINVSEQFADIKVNRMPLEKIFYNLINNAIKHHEGVQGVIDIDVEMNATHYIFSVEDDGPGIDPRYHQKVFEMFQTLKPRDHREGSGMGLAIVKKILKMRDCDITLESDLGRGAKFSFTWPRELDGEQ